jgi:hypothetical protein
MRCGAPSAELCWEAGPHSALPGALRAALCAAALGGSYVAGVRRNLLAAGDNCGRAVLVGALLGAQVWAGGCRPAQQASCALASAAGASAAAAAGSRPAGTWRTMPPPPPHPPRQDGPEAIPADWKARMPRWPELEALSKTLVGVAPPPPPPPEPPSPSPRMSRFHRRQLSDQVAAAARAGGGAELPPGAHCRCCLACSLQ